MSERFLLPYLPRSILKRIATRGTLFDFLNYHSHTTVKFETDFLGAIDARFTAGGAGTAAAMLSTTFGNGGAAGLATGAVDNQASTLYLPNFPALGDNNPTLSVRVKSSGIATGNVQIGFVDSVAAGILGATGVGPIVSPLTDPPTLVGAVADAVVATYDLSSLLATPANWRLAGSRTSAPWVVTPVTSDATKAAPTAATYQWISVAIRRSERGATDQSSAVLYVNGVEIGRKTDGAVSNVAPLVPFILIGATSAATLTLSIDAWVFHQDRDISQ